GTWTNSRTNSQSKDRRLATDPRTARLRGDDRGTADDIDSSTDAWNRKPDSCRAISGRGKAVARSRYYESTGCNTEAEGVAGVTSGKVVSGPISRRSTGRGVGRRGSASRCIS